jgi:predicted DNA-binding transcriptional regulator AlpA
VANPAHRAGRGPARCRMDSQAFYRDADGDQDIRPLAVRPQKAAEMLGISITSLWRLHKAGEIPHFKHGGKVFYRVASLDAWLAKGERYAQDEAS